MQKKKLLIASDTFLPRWDGVSRFLAEVVPRLSMDYEVRLLVPDFNIKKIKVRNVEITAIPIYKFAIGDYNPPRLRPRKVKKLVKWADTIFTQTIGPIGALTIIYAKRMKKPLYAYMHSIEWELVPKSIDKFKSFFSLLTKLIAKYLYNKCDDIMVPSEQIKKILSENGIKADGKVIPLGVNANEFLPAENKEEAKKKIGISADSLIIGYVGRIGREKDLPTLYKAFRVLKERYTNLKLLIVGPGLKLEDIFKDMEEVRDHIIYIESTNKAQDYYQAMDVFVLPSLT
ncbi:MAG: glycosyltransferase family 4 protein, partial [Candidatus Woesearchaeota archaeon]|nr:glycosyltransferase family 4 protein [Candidatus Woesearchaeota archaeon]